MYLYIAGVDRTNDLISYVGHTSSVITDEQQERTNKANFELRGAKPAENAEVRKFSAFPVISADANSVTLQADYKMQDLMLFRVGDPLYVSINSVNEERLLISSISNVGGNIKIVATTNFTNVPSIGSIAGKLEFAGNIVDIEDFNIEIAQNLQYRTGAIDYTRIFDKSNINDSFTNVDARYIVNAFCNRTINRNDALDSMDYEDNTAIQAVWTQSGDGLLPVMETGLYQEGSGCAKFAWTYSTGTASFTGAIPSRDETLYTGASSGVPTKGVLGLWLKFGDYTTVSSIDIKIGSSSSNYVSFSITPTSNEFVFWDKKLKTLSATGSPNWTALSYVNITVHASSSSYVLVDGIRLLEEKFMRHYPYVYTSGALASFSAALIKPTEAMQKLADILGWYWYIDYERYIHLFPSETNIAPFALNETSLNYSNLQISYDTSRLINRIIVKGADQASTSFYYEVRQGDGLFREWLTKTNFKALSVFVDRNTSTATMGVGTTTTSIVSTGHGLKSGDFIVNRTRSNAVRQIVVVDANTFTVDAVTSQTSGDTYSKFIEMNVGQEGFDSDDGFDYMQNPDQKSIRAVTAEATLKAGEFIQFKYHEVLELVVQRQRNASINNVIAILGHTDGIIDGVPIKDEKIKTRSEATKLAEAFLDKYSNTVITATFSTNYNGLKSGMLISIKDTDNSSRNINQQFVIQQVVQKELQNGYFEYNVTCSSFLYGIMEFFTQLLRKDRLKDLQVDDQILNIYGFAEQVEMSDSVTVTLRTPPFTWGVSTNDCKWGLGEWG